MHRMTFGRLTLGFGLLGLLAVEFLVAVAAAQWSTLPNGWRWITVSIVGFIGGVVLGLCVWVVWRVVCWLAAKRSSGQAVESR